MTESLAWLRAPEAEHALGDLLCGLIRDIRRILGQPELGTAAKLGAITDTVEQLAPPPGPQADAARTAARVMALLARNTGPATLLFEQLAGEQVRIELTERTDRPLTAAECQDLQLTLGASGHYRAGVLRTVPSGLVAAEVTSLVIGPRIPGAARRSLGIPVPGEPVPPPTGLPLGKALAALGVHREALGARLASDRGPGGPGRLAVESAARMWLAGTPVALATERVTGEFLAHVGRRPGAGRSPGLPGQGDLPVRSGTQADRRLRASFSEKLSNKPCPRDHPADRISARSAAAVATARPPRGLPGWFVTFRTLRQQWCAEATPTNGHLVLTGTPITWRSICDAVRSGACRPPWSPRRCSRLSPVSSSHVRRGVSTASVL